MSLNNDLRKKIISSQKIYTSYLIFQLFILIKYFILTKDYTISNYCELYIIFIKKTHKHINLKELKIIFSKCDIQFLN